VPRRYFISDLHLDPGRPRITDAFARFLRQHDDCDALFVLGDLFDAWIGDDDDAPLANRVRGLLRAFTAAGPDLYLMRGNRDFLLGERFCREVGATLLADPTIVRLSGQPTLLMHGDSLCIEDTDYQAFRRSVRDPAWRANVLARSLAERRTLASGLREMSGERRNDKPEEIMDASLSEVARVMAEHSVRQMIHGHTHRPAEHHEPGGTRWVLGEWDRAGWAVEATEKSIGLINFNIY
jgi:UDP-2,3-diacylglucosamine hydrolase